MDAYKEKFRAALNEFCTTAANENNGDATVVAAMVLQAMVQVYLQICLSQVDVSGIPEEAAKDTIKRALAKQTGLIVDFDFKRANEIVNEWRRAAGAADSVSLSSLFGGPPVKANC